MANTIVENKKALFDFIIEDQFEAGISLKGWEVKSLRDNRGHIKESYAILRKNEVFLIGAHFSPLQNANLSDDSEITRSRKLLLNKKEISKLIGLIQQKGYTLIPISLYWRGGKVKVKLGLAKGRKQTDKRMLIKERDWKREQQRLGKKQLQGS
jgi:SsrA-binding protein